MDAIEDGGDQVYHLHPLEYDPGQPFALLHASHSRPIQ